MISNESIRQNGCSNSDRPCQALTGEPAIDAVCCIRSNEPMHYGHAQYLPIAPPLFALLAGALIPYWSLRRSECCATRTCSSE
jgi:hypothetical protein